MSDDRLGEQISSPISAYEMRARVLPGLVLAAPISLTAMACFASMVDLGQAVLATGLTGTAVLLVFGALANALGRRAQAILWRRWGGPPSRLLLTPSDATLSEQMKGVLHCATEEHIGMEFPSASDFARDPDEAGRRVDGLFLQVRGVLRRRDPNGFWAVQNADYGFVRNLYGVLGPLTHISLMSALICLVWAYAASAPLAYIGAFANAAIAAGAALAMPVLEQHVRHRAFSYAESAWEAFLQLHKRSTTDGDASAHLKRKEKCNDQADVLSSGERGLGPD